MRRRVFRLPRRSADVPVSTSKEEGRLALLEFDALRSDLHGHHESSSLPPDDNGVVADFGLGYLRIGLDMLGSCLLDAPGHPATYSLRSFGRAGKGKNESVARKSLTLRIQGNLTYGSSIRRINKQAATR
jgi:hypothetical protein